MDPGQALDEAALAHRRALDNVDQARAALTAAMVAAREAGMTPGEIERRSGYQREHVRRILRDAGFGPAR